MQYCGQQKESWDDILRWVHESIRPSVELNRVQNKYLLVLYIDRSMYQQAGTQHHDAKNLKKFAITDGDFNKRSTLRRTLQKSKLQKSTLRCTVLCKQGTRQVYTFFVRWNQCTKECLFQSTYKTSIYFFCTLILNNKVRRQ